MKTVLNMTSHPVRVTLPRGGILHLGPHREGHIQDRAVEGSGIQRRLRAGEIQIYDSDIDGGRQGSREACRSRTQVFRHDEASENGDR